MAATIEIKLSADPRQQPAAPAAPAAPPAVQPTPSPPQVQPSPPAGGKSGPAYSPPPGYPGVPHPSVPGVPPNVKPSPAPPAVKPVETVQDEARRRLEAEQRAAEIKREMDRRRTPEVQAHDPAAEKAEAAKGVGQVGQAAEAAGLEGAAGIGGLAAMGPVGLAIAAVKLIKDQVDKTMTKIGDAFRDTAAVGRGISEVTSVAAGGENVQAVDVLTGKMVDLSKRVPLVGDQLGLLAGTAHDLVGAFRDSVMAFVARGRELSGYNASLASSYAQSDVRALQGDIREANALGPQLSRLNDAQSRASDSFRDAVLPLKEAVIEVLVPLVEGLATRLDRNRDFGTALQTTIKTAASAVILAMQGEFTAAVDAIEKNPAAVADAIDQKQRARDAQKTLIEQFFKILDDAAPPFGGIQGENPFGQPPQLGVPIVNARQPG